MTSVKRGTKCNALPKVARGKPGEGRLLPSIATGRTDVTRAIPMLPKAS